MTTIELAARAWRARWAARLGADAAAHVGPITSQALKLGSDNIVFLRGLNRAPQNLPEIDLAQFKPGQLAEPHDLECDRAKAGWRLRHRWLAPPPPVCANLAGDVTAGTVGQVVAAIRNQPDSPVFLTISSAGGCPQAAMRLYDALRSHCAPVAIHVPDRCSSAALLCLVAGDVRTAAPAAVFMAHNSAYVVRRTGRDTAGLLRASAAALDVIDEEMAAIITSRSRYAAWQLRADMAAETVLGAREAWLRGMITRNPND